MKEMLDLYPFRECRYEVNGDIVTVFYDKFEKTWVDKVLRLKKERTAKVDFDEVGSFIWLLCDGKVSVGEIINKAEEHFKDKVKPADERVSLFLSQLENRKFIRFYKKTV